MNINRLAIAVSDIDLALSFYRAIGLEAFVCSEGYARLRCPEGPTALSLIQQAAAPTGGSVTIYLESTDLRTQVERLQAAGHSFVHTCMMKSWGWEEARLLDPFRNTICLFTAGPRRYTA